MKSELRLQPHSELRREQVIEIWHNGEFIGAVYGADGPGIRIVTKHQLSVTPIDVDVIGLETVQINIQPKTL